MMHRTLSSASNAIYEINTLRKQLQGKEDTIRNLETQINITRMLNVGSTEGSCDQTALETDIIQLQDMIYLPSIQLVALGRTRDFAKTVCMNCQRRIPLTVAAEHRKSSALTAENTAESPSTGENKSVPSTSEETQSTCFRILQRRTKPATEPRKPMPKSDTRNHRIWPSKSENARRAAIHNRNLNFDHNQFVIRSLKSVNTKPPRANILVNHTKKVWKATRKHNVNTTKTAWRPKKVVGSVKPQWRPTGRHFGLFDTCPLTRIVEPIVEPLELTPSVRVKTKGFSKLMVQKSNSRVQEQDGRVNSYSKVLIDGNPQGECHINMKKPQGAGIFTLESLSEKAQGVTITDCHAGNPCVHICDPTSQSKYPMIGMNKG
ncbi:hypothetical protein Tco_0144324 [Tanacetum coccineum]